MPKKTIGQELIEGLTEAVKHAKGKIELPTRVKETENMTTAVAKVEDFDLELAKRTGAYVPSPTTILPRLAVNRDAEAGPMGHYVVSNKENDEIKRVFASTATFRAFINAYQYQEYDGKANEFVNRSIIFSNFNEEAHDEKGGLACGKVKRDLWETLSGDEQVRQGNIKCNRLMYGLVTFQNADVPVENLPVLFKVAGSNFMAPKDALAVITKARHQFPQHNLLLNAPIRQKKGATTYFEIPITVDMASKLDMSNEDWDTLTLFEEIIERENGFILSKWRAAKKKVLGVSDQNLLDSLKLDDELPF